MRMEDRKFNRTGGLSGANVASPGGAWQAPASPARELTCRAGGEVALSEGADWA